MRLVLARILHSYKIQNFHHKNKMKKIIIKNISKSFNIGTEKKQSALATILTTVSSRESKKRFKVLDDVSLEIVKGDIIGITGSNGSGKSTLLRIIAGIYTPESGTLEVRGKIISIINLGVGLIERLPMRDNIFIVGSLFGMSKKLIKEKFESIIDFSGLHKFVGTKIYQFSAGMIQRLAFSIAIHADPDILLLDEVFEVGDESFKRQSGDKIRQMASEGMAVVVVSHDMDIIGRYCKRVITMDNGRIISDVLKNERT